MTREPEREKQESSLVAMARYSGHGLTLALSMVLFLLLGWWADGKLGTSPVLTLIGAFVGAAAGFYSMLQHLIFVPRARERDEQERERQRAAAGPQAAGGPADAEGGGAEEGGGDA